MNIDITEINNELLGKRTDLTDLEKEFISKVNNFRDFSAKCAKSEIDGIIQKYAKIEAETIIEFYDEFRKTEVSK